MRPTPAACPPSGRLSPWWWRRLALLLAVLLGLGCLGGCGSRGDSAAATAGAHIPGMTDYDNQMLFTDSPGYTKYDLR